MPSSIDRSAPAHSASFPEVMTTPFTAASVEVCFTISASSATEVSSSTFIERPGVSQVTSTMPSESVSTLKFLKAMLSLPRCRQPVGAAVVSEIVGWAKRSVPTETRLDQNGGHGAKRAFAHPTPLNPLDDGRGAHAAADAQRDQRGRFVGALELVEHGTENHRTGGAERMAERDGAAIDIDLGVVDVEGLHVAQHHRGERLVQLEQIDVGFLHARALEQLFGDIDRTGQHHRRLPAAIGEGLAFSPARLGARRGGSP